MRKSIAIATALAAGAGATGIGATDTIPNPWYGSDTVENVVRDGIANAVNLSASLKPDYVAGGSGTGQSAMVAGTQSITPMSKMLTSSGGACKFAGGASGSSLENASGIVIGLDAVDVLASVTTGAQAACTTPNSTVATSDGLAVNGSSIWGPNGNASNTSQNWKWVLALVYGGLDYSTGL
ncbi:MAG TPA: hypothetical protein VEK07_24940, partial [Polyangiaceae bacterium]|nr:hypothetical protein [Polyangiaceae bacterium]